MQLGPLLSGSIFGRVRPRFTARWESGNGASSGSSLTEVPKGHAHRFRDTFACELLGAGVPMDRVSVLLGHSSIRVTEKHYAPWTQSRQEHIEADLARAWSQDPVALLETKGTPPVRGQRPHYN